MKTKEFIEKVNKVAYAKYEDGVIDIYEGLERAPMRDWFLCISPSEQSLIDIPNWIEIGDMGSVDLFYILGLVQELRKTPVKDRFPEKKYHLTTLRYPKDATPIKQYVSDIIVGYDHVNFYFGSKEKAGVWADSDLNYLSQYFPKEAIDAMEEPAEDDE